MRPIRPHSLHIPGIWLLGIGLRLVYIWYVYPEVLLGDAWDYWQMAGQFVAGEMPTAYWPPGLAMWLAVWRALLGAEAWVAIVGMMVIWLLAFWLLVRLSSGMKSGLRAGLLLVFACYPAWVHQSVVPLSHMPLAAIGLLLLSLLQKRKTEGWYWAGLGLVLGIGTLIRPGSLVWLLLPLGMLLVDDRFSQVAKAGRMLGICLGAYVPLLAWTSYQPSLPTGGLLLNTATPYNLFIGNQPASPTYQNWWLGSHDERGTAAFDAYYQRLDSIQALPASQQPEAFTQAAWWHVRQHPGQMLRRIWNRGKVYWAFDMLAGGSISRRSWGFGMGLIVGDGLCYGLLMGMFFWALTSKLRHPVWWLIMALSYQLPYLLAFAHPTYHFPVMPILALWAGHQLSQQNPQLNRLWIGAVLFLGWLAIQVEWVLVRISLL